MKPRHLAMGAALLLAAGLVVFGDSTPETELAEPVERASDPVQASAAAAAPAPAAKNEEGPVVQRLIPRETLIGGSEDRFGAAEGEGG
ncbi:hypothetical protein V7778_19335, partial [Massilia sp. DD77]